MSRGARPFASFALAAVVVVFVGIDACGASIDGRGSGGNTTEGGAFDSEAREVATPGANAPEAGDLDSATSEAGARDGDAVVTCFRHSMPGCSSLGGLYGSCCNGTCIDTSADPKNCGACGRMCPSGTPCWQGACGCPLTICGMTPDAGNPSGAAICVDVQTDANNCGACGKTCATGAVCNRSSCACPPNQTVCAGTCVDLQTDANNCGACAKNCPAGCAASACLPVPVVLVSSGYSQSVPIAVDAANLYWVQPYPSIYDGGAPGSSAWKVPVGGGTTTLLAWGPYAVGGGIAVDSTSVYWTSWDSTGTGTVMSVSIGGGTATTLASGQDYPGRIAVDAMSVYLANHVSVARVPIGGGNVTVLASGQTPIAIAVDATSVYWTNGNPGAVMRIPIGGGNPSQLASGQTLWGIAVDATSVYWTDTWGNAAGGVVLKASLAGGTAKTLAPGPGSPAGIAVDATSVYWTDTDTGTVRKVPLGGGMITTLAALQSGPSGIVVDATSVYWATNDGVVKKLPK